LDSREIDLAIRAEDKRYRVAKQGINGTKDLVKELGLTFTSAFEDAIVAGKRIVRRIERHCTRHYQANGS
jgi:hypothetical protein